MRLFAALKEFIRRTIGVGMFLALAAHASQCQSASWKGTWTLEPTNQTPNADFALSSESDGMFALTTKVVSYRFRCDGRQYPVSSRMGLGETVGIIVCDKSSDTTMTLSFFKKSKLASKKELHVSADGNSLVSDASPGTGATVKSTQYTRVRGSKGLLGSWRSTAVDQSSIMNLSIQDGNLVIDFPLAHQRSAVPLNGSPAPILKDGADMGVTFSLRIGNALTLTLTTKKSGVEQQMALLRLAPDGQTILDEAWFPGDPRHRTRSIYRRAQ